MKGQDKDYCEQFELRIKALQKLDSHLVPKQKTSEDIKDPFSFAKNKTIKSLIECRMEMLDQNKKSSSYIESTKALEDALMFSLLKEQYGGKRLRGRSAVLGHLLEFIKDINFPVEPKSTLDYLIKEAELLQGRKKQVGSFVTHLTHPSTYNKEQKQVITLIAQLNENQITKAAREGLMGFVLKNSQGNQLKEQFSSIKSQLKEQKSEEKTSNEMNLTQLP